MLSIQYIDRFLEYIGDSTRYKDPSTMLDAPNALKRADPKSAPLHYICFNKVATNFSKYV